MSNINLLDTVLPSEGWICIVGLKNGELNQSFHSSKEDAEAKVQELVDDSQDAYFALARFEERGTRKKENVKALKSFWVDIDCGEKKAEVNPKSGLPDGYIDQAAGLTALIAFCQNVGLPDPFIVNSGRGIHAYWPMDKELTRQEWEPVAKRLREVCTKQQFYVDKAVFEVARILRVPGTLNFKDTPPLPVEVIAPAEPTSFEEFRNILGVKEVAEIPKRELTELGKLMQDNIESSFTKIMVRSANGSGCNQILSAYKERATLSEPRWFSALAVAKFCKDSDAAIHKLSSGHPGYDPVATMAKIEHIVGPHTCSQFEINNPGGCEGCPFKGKIGSPIALGKDIAKAEEPEAVATEEEFDPTAAEPVGVYKIPKYPAPFFKGKNGGIYVLNKGDEEEPLLVYEWDIYVVKRMEDPAEGEVFVMRRHLPQDGVKEFVVPNSKLVDRSELQKILATNGVICYGKPLEQLLRLLTTMAKDLQVKQRSLQMRTQFGWADGDSKFILGDQEITADGIYHTPPSSATKDFAKYFVKKGTLEKWKEVFSLYGRPGLEGSAYAALSVFGAPLLKFLGQKGAIISLVHPRSGTGKTTILHMMASVFGVPDRMHSIKDDTFNTKIHRLGVMNNLVNMLDEITNSTPEIISEIAYCTTHGRGKDRMMSQTNSMRSNNTTWATITVSTSNSSLYEKLAALKSSPDGEMMRILEYKVDYSTAIDTDLAKQMFDFQLHENYGHAGEIYTKYLVDNLEHIKVSLKSVQAKVDKELRLSQRERFWSAVITANIVGGMIAQRLGLIDWDMKAIYKWVTELVSKMREEVVAPVNDGMVTIGEFLNRNMNNMLVVDGLRAGKMNLQSIPTMEPRGELMVRYEPDTKRMMIAVKALKTDCVHYSNNYRELTRDLEQKGILIDSGTKYLSTGMKVRTPAVHCIVLDTSHPEFFNMDGIIEEEVKNADRKD